VIVVNDGSTDRSSEVIAAAAAGDPRVQEIRQENQGLGAARNVGLARARGTYINFLDADDLLLPEKLEAQGAVLDARPEIDLVFCDGLGIDGAGNVLYDAIVDLRLFKEHPPLFDLLIRVGGVFQPMVPLVRRSSIAAIGGFSEVRSICGYADFDFWLRLAQRGADYAVVPRALASYRVLPDSMSSDRSGMEFAARTVLESMLAAHPGDASRALRAAQEYGRQREVLWYQRVSHLRVREEQLQRKYLALCKTVFRLLATNGGPRPLHIWGTGAAGRSLLTFLQQSGIAVHGLIDGRREQQDDKGTDLIDGVPVTGPCVLARNEQRPFVLIASAFFDAIVPRLDALGWREHWDYHVLDVELCNLAD
jgi:glycosyltransferase involved in cell wall biosynthesis